MNIVCLGDSTTYGYMVSRNKVWTEILNNKFENKDIKFINKWRYDFWNAYSF